jgi:hypothetical protein
MESTHKIKKTRKHSDSVSNKNTGYNKEYVEMIKQAEKDLNDGKGKVISIDDLWK